MNAQPRPRANQDQCREPVRICQGEALRDTASHGMADEGCAWYPQCVEQVPHEVPVPPDCSTPGPLALSVAGKIRGQPIPARCQVAQLESPLLLRTPRAVYKGHHSPAIVRKRRRETVMDGRTVHGNQGH